MHGVTPRTTTWKKKKVELKMQGRKQNTKNIQLAQYSWEYYYTKYLYSKTDKTVPQ